ncbi:membrane-bound PQQ-dependent dehydrogenase, glucose/quinate/shikimate family [Acetobacter suratthaniensis]|uniref:Membrane-bound PQQ-dependent dehydrogenase, glucose/quinate/shikimate family n=1 Tax=Acetobacter suratthaniensis TaxID=1502841 RepID=A0ABS3LLQ6_9PROT|nr:membrane-bound PQQ-dependent dehydrogenase, glucose/quinate/shikimate family [Acetobacter suratthaniensis]MBO1328299.1 membrane-bound PQQ-dependent dehydrogenase, glucose/quinate/shikimate family [Acetobacter suratthaniensis]MCX2566422.1 membrane-bound PQQ-dependent dehydrogenase, glucose/quinate/shikimate family [Acetobacter suratthaniensis]
MNITTPQRSWITSGCRIAFALISLAVGIALLYGGFRLVTLGGSLYYLIAGIAYAALGGLFLLRQKTSWALILSVAIFVATVLWALYDTPALAFWPLLPRLMVPAVLFMLSLLTAAIQPDTSVTTRRFSAGGGITVLAGVVVTLVAMFSPHGGLYGEGFGKARVASTVPTQPDDWQFYGRNANGTRYVPYTQITPQNVTDLKVAWVYHTGRRTKGPGAGVDENTPMQVGTTLYTCTPENVVAAVDADNGKELWRFDPHAHAQEHVSCRGVGYYDISADDSLSIEDRQAATNQPCAQRIVVSTVDARLFTVDAHTGNLCQGFGNNGYVDLKPNMGPTENGKRYHPTAVPVIMGHLAVIGGWVRDIVHGEPSGAVRAYDVRTGDLAWAWDVGNPDNPVPPDANTPFTLETPNVWAIPTYDKALNQVYLPTGNGPPDYWGGDRDAVKNKFGAALVAVDATTGKTKWVRQLTHHDVWDFDLPSQPVMYDVTNEKGEKVPSLIQTTKTGHIFVIDRRNGEFVTAVEERPVPTTPAAQGEQLSPTQPFSVGMPTIGADPLSEQAMWGVSTFDQLYCRIMFKNSVYEGPYTPPGEKPYIEWPSLLGGMNWGGISIDEANDIMFVNDMRMPLRMMLVNHEDAKHYKISTDEVPGFMGTLRPQIAGPYSGVRIDILQSPLQVPCNTPPFGTMSAIDLRTKKLLWQVPMGTAEQLGPMGIKSHLPMPMGMPTLGGPTTTASGLLFFAGTQDYYLRALDSMSGKELWKAPLPAGAVAAPLVYKSPKTGKEYVVISVGGASHSPDVADDVIAFDLPTKE